MRVSYELQIRVKDRWTIDQVFTGEKKVQAIEEAKRLNGEAHITAVKLICEAYNESTNQSTEVVVFHTDRELGERRRAERNAPSTPAPAAAPAAPGSAPIARAGEPKPKGASVTKMTMMAVGLLLTALVLVAVLMTQGEQIAAWLQTS